MAADNSASPVDHALRIFRDAQGTLPAGQARARNVHLRRRGASVDALLRHADTNRARNVMMPYIEAVL